MEDEAKELFVRIPLENFKFADSYEEYKAQQMKLTNPEKLINYLEEVYKDIVITISFSTVEEGK